MLTHRQKQAFDYLGAEISRSGGVAPSRRQMAADLGTALNNVSRLINVLEERGAIRRIRHKARAIEIVPPERIGWLKFNDETKQLEPWGRE